ncbi:pantothenate kinase 1-like [Zingiber officinale]|uniref:pantothenate kinase 1-like n=1 Tax=Zingiber officinale TaxID=94328 RepID=UPI001C4B96F0|nr:pantothenate kinase 1-like [Zingiber officinale]XP_042443311.1 pantothenate kinase 1-like [Zingiber officinale]
MGGRQVVLDLGGAEIRGDFEKRNPPIALPKQRLDSSLLALDIGGTLIKLVYFADGLLHFVKFERRRLHECFDFIRSKNLISGKAFSPELSNGHVVSVGFLNGHATLKATGGGAFKFSGKFKDDLGVTLEKLDEIDSVVAGANFLLKEIPGASFTHIDGRRKVVEIDKNNLYPYLLVNIGSGVGIIKVTGNRKFERVTGTHIGGGTIFGLAKLLTGCLSYDEFLKMSQQGDNLVLDLIVKDICGELVSEKQGLSSSTLASSFGKVIASKTTLSDYKPEDLATTLLSAFTYNIAQIGFLVAALLGLKRVFFGGSYIRGHPSTMDNISYAINYWSKGQMEATFFRHEGFLGALGALMSYNDHDTEDTEMECDHEPSANMDGNLTSEHNEHSIFPYLLVNVGSGVSMIEVIEKWKFQRIIGTHLGGGTILGLARLLTGCTSYAELLELSQRGNNLAVDLTVGDIYGEQGYSKHGLPASTTASAFGKVTSNKLSDYKAEDLAAALLNAFTYNLGQISWLVAKLSGLKKIFFRGTYICGHEQIMDKISRSLRYWSKGQLQTTFLCHEEFLGAVGAFWSYENMGIDELATKEVIKQVLLGAPYVGEKSPSWSPKKLSDNLRQKDDQMTSQMELEKLRHENTELKDEVTRLLKENAELRAKLEESHDNNLQNSCK